MSPSPTDAAVVPRWRRWFRPGRIFKIVLGLALLYAFAVFYGPRVTATRYEADLKRELERVLGRTVEFRDVRYSFYPSPGLSAKNLVIHESPTFGIEPLAYVGEIRVGVRWLPLLAGRLECSSVRLDDASLNIARTEEAGWNFAVFLSQITAGLKRGAHAPAIQIRDGRINFRDGLRKSPFFLNSVDLDIAAPDAPGGELSWTYEASPARTDRSEQGFGRLSGTGAWRSTAGRNGILDIDLELERSVISEVAILITGGDPGVQGRLSSRAHFSGPLDKVELRGTLRLGDLQRPSLFGVRGRDWSVPYEGVLNLNAQTIEVSTVAPKDGAALPVNFRLTAQEFYTRPAWKAQFLLDGLPASTLLEVATRLGSRIPPALSVDGTLNGSFDFGSASPAAGEIELRNGALRIGQNGPYRIEPAKFSLAGSEISLQPATLTPATLTSASGGASGIEGEWDVSTSRLAIRSSLRQSSLKDIRQALAAFSGLPAIPGVDACAEGTLDGDLRFERTADDATPASAGPGLPQDTDPAAHWSGSLRVSGLQCAVDGSTDPLRIERGQIAISGSAWHLRRATGHLGALAWSGEASGDASGQPPAVQPIRFAVSTGTLLAADVERLFRPTLAYTEGLLERTLSFRKIPPPPWLAARRWEGRVTAAEFEIAGEKYTKFNAHVLWNGASIDLADLSALQSGGLISGRGSVRAGPAGPVYRLRGVVDSLNWEGHGTVEGEFGLTASGFGGDLLDSLNLTGQVASRRLEMAGETFDQVAADFDYDGARQASRLRLSGVTALVDGAPLVGAGGSAGDNRWHAELGSGARVFKLSGTFPPFRLENDPGTEPRAR
jgi:hypothetical protein